jgi:hypothetical protein
VGTLSCHESPSVCLLLPNPVVHADIRDSVTMALIANRASSIVTGEDYYDSTFVAVLALATSARTATRFVAPMVPSGLCERNFR